MVTDSATVTMESLQKTTIALSNDAIADPLRPLLPPKRGFHMPPTYANGHISATGDQIHFMIGSMVGFSGTADRTALFTVRINPRWQPLPCCKNFKWPYLRNRSYDHFMFCSRVGFSGTADLMALFSIRTNSRWRPPPSWIFRMATISATATYIARIARSSLR